MHFVSAHTVQRLNGARAAHLCKCPSAAVGKPIQRVRAAADFGAPASEGYIETLDYTEVYGSIESLVVVWEDGLDVDKVVKVYSGAEKLMEVWRKILPGPVEVIRTSDPTKIPGEGSHLEDGELLDGMIVGRWVLISRGTTKAVEDYLLESLGVDLKRGAAYVVYKGRNRKMKNRVSMTKQLIAMVRDADMFLVHGPDATASDEDAKQ